MTNDNTEEWGPWIEHDGKGYPSGVIGMICQVTQVCRVRGIFTDEPFLCMGHYPDGGSWNWANYPVNTKITRYRIRKPKGMKILEALLENLPEEVDA